VQTFAKAAVTPNPDVTRSESPTKPNRFLLVTYCTLPQNFIKIHGTFLSYQQQTDNQTQVKDTLLVGGKNNYQLCMKLHQNVNLL